MDVLCEAMVVLVRKTHIKDARPVKLRSTKYAYGTLNSFISYPMT